MLQRDSVLRTIDFSQRKMEKGKFRKEVDNEEFR